MLNRHDAREKLVFTIYQHLLLHKELPACFENNFEDGEYDEFITNVRDDLIENEKNYIDEIGKHLVKWTFDRLNLVEQAILLETVAELHLNLNDRAVVIDEAVILAKTYCDDDSYRFINGVLDHICNSSQSAVC
ncbi:MAG: transcription antitermination factor NusB [Erysipelotrichaceae bacterium]|nr:transcription antitermination factor NusB [Erysipelotrichaceae bacterium]